MAIQVMWQDYEKTILEWEIQAAWTADHFEAACQQSRQMIAQTAHPFDVIINANQVAPPPFAISLFRAALRRASPLQQSLIVVDGRKMTEIVLKTLIEAEVPNADRLYVVASMSEATRLINQRRRTLLQ